MKIERGDIIYMHKEAYKSIFGAGNLQFGMRPLLVVSNDTGNKYSNICIVVPMTKKNKNNLPTHCEAGEKNSIALCEQLFTINQSDVFRIVGKANEQQMRNVNKCLKISLALERG